MPYVDPSYGDIAAFLDPVLCAGTLNILVGPGLYLEVTYIIGVWAGIPLSWVLGGAPPADRTL